jgi:hypothetical protein
MKYPTLITNIAMLISMAAAMIKPSTTFAGNSITFTSKLRSSSFKLEHFTELYTVSANQRHTTWHQSKATQVPTSPHSVRIQPINMTGESSRIVSLSATKYLSGPWINATTIRPSAGITPTPRSSESKLAHAAIDSAYYMQQVDNAIYNLVAVIKPNDTSSTMACHDSVEKIPTAPLPINSSTPTMSPSSNPDHPNLDNAHFDLIFLNATSPSYILLDHSNNFVMIWQAPKDESSTSQITEFLAITKDFQIWAKVYYYWARIIFFVASGTYALYRAIMFVKKIRDSRREPQAHGNVL